ncbi:MAG: zf-HC2 domain-containing protein [candidate division Zixibacteria bacterium]|nr:zf-HC2 domain-containing protein [candidate division Zixibacteria bacterium]
MTHRHITDVIDDYIDEELDISTAEEVRRHLEQCRTCRAEYELALRLRNILSGNSAPDPGEDYFNEVSALISAKTVETYQTETAVTNLEQQRRNNKRAFYRSLVSVAASLVIFFTALIFGSTQNKPVTVNVLSYQGTSRVAAATENDDNDNVILTPAEQRNLIKGIILLGSPGHFEQCGILSDLLP